MLKTSAKIAEDITIAWLNTHVGEGVAKPGQAEVAEFYRAVFEAVKNSTTATQVGV
ncbi:MAG: hypothetical protein GX335_06670 [Firmicutes bacterium]|nr:hypothetical protein [Bacillota bacterium]